MDVTSREGSALGRCALVGNGRLGRSLAVSLDGFDGPFGRGFDGRTDAGVPYDLVLLVVPDDEIGRAAEVLGDVRLVGHCSGALGVGVLAPREAFGVHPLMTVTDVVADFAGAGAAVAGTTPRALAAATEIARRLGMHGFEIADEQRALYHAAASIAANFLVTLVDAADGLMSSVGAPPGVLAPLVRAALENWIAQGGPRALTGPLARGDEHTVALQRAAVMRHAPALVAMFDALAERTRALALRARQS